MQGDIAKRSFARHVEEAHDILAKMKNEARNNHFAINSSRRIIGDSWNILKSELLP